MIPIRDNFGVELLAGNQPGSRGLWSPNINPYSSAYQLSRVVKMGEGEYTRVLEQEALDYIDAHPSAFVRNTLFRIGWFWVGTPMESRRLGKLQFIKYLPALTFSVFVFYGAARTFHSKSASGLLFIAVLFCYPLLFYVTHTGSGFMYQYPIQPEMLALATLGVVREKGTPITSTYKQRPLSSTLRCTMSHFLQHLRSSCGQAGTAV
jgi:hypothetical protein